MEKVFHYECPEDWRSSDVGGYELYLKDPDGIKSCSVEIKNYYQDVDLGNLKNKFLSEFEEQKTRKILEPPLLKTEFTIGLKIGESDSDYIFRKEIVEPENHFLRILNFIKKLFKRKTRKTVKVYRFNLEVYQENDYNIYKNLIKKTILSFKLKRPYLLKITEKPEEKTTPDYISIADSALSNKNYNKALENYDKALNYVDPEDVKAWNNKGYALLELGRYLEAFESYDKASEIDPNNVVAWNGKGNTQIKLSRYCDAFESFKKVLEINKNHENALDRINEIEPIIKKRNC